MIRIFLKKAYKQKMMIIKSEEVNVIQTIETTYDWQASYVMSAGESSPGYFF